MPERVQRDPFHWGTGSIDSWSRYSSHHSLIENSATVAHTFSSMPEGSMHHGNDLAFPKNETEFIHGTINKTYRCIFFKEGLFSLSITMGFTV